MTKPPTGHLHGRWIRANTRKAIYERDDYRCTYCGRDLKNAPANEIVLDHVEPHGGNGTSNLTTCCKACNDRKEGKSGVDFVDTLDEKPHVKAALLKKLAKAKAKAGGKAQPQPPKKKAKKLAADVLNVNKEATKADVVSRVNRKGTAKAKRKRIAGKPSSRRSLAASKPKTMLDKPTPPTMSTAFLM